MHNTYDKSVCMIALYNAGMIKRKASSVQWLTVERLGVLVQAREGATLPLQMLTERSSRNTFFLTTWNSINY